MPIGIIDSASSTRANRTCERRMTQEMASARTVTPTAAVIAITSALAVATQSRSLVKMPT